MNIDTLDTLIGDMPISEQLGIALEHMAPKAHKHTEYADRNEVEDLKKKIELLLALVGDTPVSDQIADAIKNIK